MNILDEASLRLLYIHRKFRGALAVEASPEGCVWFYCIVYVAVCSQTIELCGNRSVVIISDMIGSQLSPSGLVLLVAALL
jgi:hypothetical protein